MKWYDYDSFVEVSKRVMQGRNRIQQQEVVREVLLSMLPPGAPEQVTFIIKNHYVSLHLMKCFCLLIGLFRGASVFSYFYIMM